MRSAAAAASLMPGTACSARGSALNTPGSEPKRCSSMRASGFTSMRGITVINSASITS
jgi:hypothetical protein